MLEKLTFTGIDSQTSFEALSTFADRWPRVEFGVLVGSATSNEDNGIFPPLETVGRLREWGREDGRQTAIHLCGSWARGVMRLGGASEAIYGICSGFGRVQVNLHPDNYLEPRRISVDQERVALFADRVDCEKVILQHRGAWDAVPVKHPKVEYLFDRSEGAGREAFDEWPEPSSELPRMGYAGGIGPHNISMAMEFVERHGDVALWLDMEGRIRNGNGLLDHGAVKAVCERAFL